MDLDATLAAIKKAYGSDAILTLDDAEFAGESFSSGCTALDIALSCGGWPRGRMIEVFGPESSGKTTLALHAIASCQKNLNLRAAIIDWEHAIDPVYAESLGVDIKKLFISQPTTAEEGIDIMGKLTKTKEFGIIVGDSVASMTTKQQLEGNIGDANIASLARLLSQEVKQVVNLASTNNTSIMWINQLREKPGLYGGEYTPGGRAIKFYSSIRCRISKDGSAESENQKTKVKVSKNKCGRPFNTCDFQVLFGKGIDEGSSLLDLALKNSVIMRKGSSYTIKLNSGVMTIGHGKDEAIKTMMDKYYKLVRGGVMSRAMKK